MTSHLTNAGHRVLQEAILKNAMVELLPEAFHHGLLESRAREATNEPVRRHPRSWSRLDRRKERLRAQPLNDHAAFMNRLGDEGFVLCAGPPLAANATGSACF